jgi:hypothetical protein
MGPSNTGRGVAMDPFNIGICVAMDPSNDGMYVAMTQSTIQGVLTIIKSHVSEFILNGEWADGRRRKMMNCGVQLCTTQSIQFVLYDLHIQYIFYFEWTPCPTVCFDPQCHCLASTQRRVLTSCSVTLSVFWGPNLREVPSINDTRVIMFLRRLLERMTLQIVTRCWCFRIILCKAEDNLSFFSDNFHLHPTFDLLRNILSSTQFVSRYSVRVLKESTIFFLYVGRIWHNALLLNLWCTGNISIYFSEEIRLKSTKWSNFHSHMNKLIILYGCVGCAIVFNNASSRCKSGLLGGRKTCGSSPSAPRFTPPRKPPVAKRWHCSISIKTSSKIN